MLFRTMTITILLCGSITCSDDLLDMDEWQMRVIAKEVRGTMKTGAAQCKETARKTVHADVHLSPAQLDNLSSLKCLSLPNLLSCKAEDCTCSTDGAQDDDDNYSASCTHAEDGKTTSKTFTFNSTDIATFEPPTSGTTTPPDDSNTPPDDSNTPPDDSNTPPDDSNTPPDDSNTPPDTNPVACQSEGADTLNYGENILLLASNNPNLGTQMIVGMECTSSASGANRLLVCESIDCRCRATFKLNTVPTYASCVEL